MSFVAGSLFRIFPDKASTKHYTAVLLKNNTLLEVKNPYTTEKRVFESLEKWCESYSKTLSDIVIDTTKASSDPVKSTNNCVTHTHGFLVPTTSQQSFRWLKWCYSIICEIAPELLHNIELKNAYNKLVGLITPHMEYIRDYATYSSDKYNIQHLNTIIPKYPIYGSSFGGMSLYVHNPEYARANNLGLYEKFPKSVSDEITATYNHICTIVKPLVKEYMEMKYGRITMLREFRTNNRNIKSCNKKIDKLQSKIDYFNKTIRRYTEENVVIETHLMSLDE